MEVDPSSLGASNRMAGEVEEAKNDQSASGLTEQMQNLELQS